MDFFRSWRDNIFRSCKSTPEVAKEQEERKRLLDSSFFTNLEYKKSKASTSEILVELDENGYYDILTLYHQIKQRLEKANLITDIKQKEKLEWIIANTDDATELRLAKDKLFALEQTKKKEDQLDEFCSKAQEIIYDYSKACLSTYFLDFVTFELRADLDKIKLQQDILSNFLSFCQEYSTVRTSNKNQLVWKCCENPVIISDNGLNYCANCPATFTTVDTVGTFSDQKRIATNSKPKYYNIKHFISAIKKSQGIHKKNIDPSLDAKQDEYMKHHGIALEDYTIFNLMDLLTRDSTLSCYYKDIHLIYRQKTGKQINNLGNVERDLPKWYKEQDKYSDIIKLKEDGTNSINAYYMVCRLAQLKGGRIDLKLENFFCAKDKKTIAKYDDCFEKRCYALGWLKEGEKLTDWCK
jgi:hypothetical protein